MKPDRSSSERIVLTTHLAPEEALQHLSHAIEKQLPILPLQPRPKHWLFAGMINGNHFSICRIPAGKRIYENQIDGTIEQTATGSLITLTIQPHTTSVVTNALTTVVLIIFAIIFILGPLYLTITGQIPPNCGLFPLVVATVCFLIFRSAAGSPPKLDLDAITALGHLKSLLHAEEVNTDRSLPPEA